MPAGAPQGNSNAAKAKVFNAAMMRAFKARSKTEALEALDAVALQLVDQGLAGEQWAICEIANRLDGKPAQQIVHSGDSESPLTITIKRFTEGVGA